jgi:hypothetical protein
MALETINGTPQLTQLTNESAEYVARREELRLAEIELMRQRERKDGNVVCFFQSAKKFNTRHATFGFSDKANLDEVAMWPVAFALKELTGTEEARIAALVKKAAV